MRPPINFRDAANQITPDNLGRTFDWICQQIEGRTSATLIRTITQAVVSGGGGSASKVEYRTGSVSVSAGSVTITFSSALTTTDYLVVAHFIDADGNTSLLKSPTTKTLTGFTYTVDWPGTLVYFAIVNV